jgi:hypothetical protein
MTPGERGPRRGVVAITALEGKRGLRALIDAGQDPSGLMIAETL